MEPGVATDAPNVLHGVPTRHNPFLGLSADGRALFVSASVADVGHVAAPVLSLCLMTHVSIPAVESPAVTVEYRVAGSDLVLDPATGDSDTERPSGKASRTGDGVHIVLRLPWAALGTAKPSPDTRWRVNAVLRDGGAAGDGTPVARWGFPDLEQIWHGAVVRFDAGETPQQ